MKRLLSEISSPEDTRVIEYFRDFLRIRSVSAEGPKGSYQRCVDFLLRYAKEVGLDKYEVFSLVEGNPIVVLTWVGTDPKLKSILLNGHYDVVPADNSKWTHDPFGGERTENGNIYGRGAQDMKCVLIQYLEAVGRLLKSVREGKLAPPKRTIHISFLPDEETGGTFAAAPFVKSDQFKSLNIGLALDEGLANPNDVYTIFYGERAASWLKITAVGPTGHGSRFIPRAAIEKLTDVLQKVYKFRSEQEAKLHPKHDEVGCAHAKAFLLGDVTTINVTAIKGYIPGPDWSDGFAVNCIPGEVIAAMDVRVPPAIPVDEIENLFKEWTAEEGLKYEFYVKTAEHHVSSIEENNPWWSTIKQTFKDLGKEIQPEIFPAATDSRYFRKEQLPCYGFSPMSKTPILLHDHDEFLNENVLVEGVKVFESLIYKLANVENTL